MESNRKKGKLWHRIKYRNSVAPSAPVAGDSLRQFAVELKRRQRLLLYVNKMVKKKKTDGGGKVAPLQRVATASEDIREFCRKCPSTGMSRLQEKSILRKVAARGLELRYPILLDNIMSEARKEFLTVTQQSGIEMKLASVEKQFQFQIQPYKHFGRTSNYSIFLQRRKELKSKFILHHPLIRRILNECVTKLPYELFNLNACLKSQWDADEFQKHIFDYANDAAQRLQEFYRKIVGLVEHEKVNAQNARSYLGACTGLLSVNISRTIAHTLLHVVSFTASKEHTPYLKLNITFKDRLILEPTADDIIEIYNKFFRKIIDSSKQFYVLEKYKIKGYGNKHIHLCLTNEFFESILKQISNNIKEKYDPILKYIKGLDDEFVDIYSDLCSGSSTISTSDLIFEDGCKKLLYFKSYLPKVAFIPDNAYFTIGQLIITEYREVLKRTLLDIIDNIFGNLSAQYEWENNDICEAFDIIYVRATQKPITTEEVIEIGKYMAWVRNEYLNELKERVIKALEYLTKLIQLGPLKENHIIINAKAINWLDKISPILEENIITYEQLKFEAEEKLQKVIEDINVDIKDVYPLLDILDSMDNIENVRSYLNTITLHMVKIKEIENKIEWINKEEVSLSFPKSSYAEFDELKNYVYPFYHLLKLSLDVQRNLSVWLDGQFDLINYVKVKETVEKYYKELLRTQKVYRSKLRQAQDENLSLRFKGTVDDPDMLNWPAPLKLCSKAIKLIQDFEPSLAVIKIMCNEALMKRHWQKMSKVASFDITPNAGTTLRKIIQIDLKPDIDKYELISLSATKERELLQNLEQMLREWADVDFKIGEHKQIKIIIELEDIEIVADDHMIKVINMLNSIYVKPYDNQVKDFYNKLQKITLTIQECRQAQQGWLHFLPLFLCSKIALRMSSEAEIFKQITDTYTDYIQMIHTQPNVYTTVNDTNILQDLLKCNQQLELINHGVNSYFNRIRCHFPRFYFVSNEEMFRILSLTKEPTQINRFIKSLFYNVGQLIFSNSTILSVVSENNELMPLIESIDTAKFEGCVEKWLQELETQINASIEHMIQNAIKTYSQENWSLQWPSQILQTVTNIIFTSNGTKAIEDNTLKNYHSELLSNTNRIINIIKSEKIDNTARINIRALLTTMKIHIDTIWALNENSVTSTDNFKWLSKLRYYSVDKKCIVRIFDTQIKYGYEYVGNQEQIVITSQTERCYHSLILALKYCLCSGLKGSTGTGKTETVKALARAVATQCTYFGCSEFVTFEVILEYIKGIVSTGTWMVLDDIDKVPSEVCSILSQELSRLLSALRSNISVVCLNSVEICLQKCFLTFTMQTFDYFPESFRTLFRPLALTTPDISFIVEVNLFSLGYQEWLQLGRKVTTTFSLMEQLLPNSEINFGLKIIKECIRYCQNMQYVGMNPEESIFKALQEVVIPKLSFHEKSILENILLTIFSYSTSYVAVTTLENDIIQFCQDSNLMCHKTFIEKICQLKETIDNNSGVILFGQTYSGKSTSIHVLSKIQKEKTIFINTLSPKTFTLEQLYGGIDSNTLHWYDGIITKYLREDTIDEDWIVLDGPADNYWVESINSLLDQNKKLCLSSGEILYLRNNKRIIFEVDNLSQASPSMIARCGIIYIDPEAVNWKCVVTSWIQGTHFEWKQGFEENISVLFEWVVPPCLEFLKECQQVCELNYNGLVKTAVQIFEMFLIEAYDSILKKEEDPKNFPAWIQASFIQAIIWGIGSNLDSDSRIKFDEFFKQLWRGQNKCYPYPKSLEKVDVSVPAEEPIFDHSYLYKSKGNWKFWPDVLKNEKIEECLFTTDIFIPTNETIKYTTMINMHVTHKYPSLLVGPPGTGKTVLILDILMNRLNTAVYDPAFLAFTPKMTSNQTQKLIVSNLFKKKSGRYGPAEGKHCILFIDDFHEPEEDNYGTKPSLEIIRELLDRKMWYHLDNFKSLYVDDINMVAAMTFSNNLKMCQRLLRHFSVFSINGILEDSILRIFSNSLLTKWRKIGFPSDIIGTINQIVSASYHFYKSVNELTTTLDWNFYYFNMRNFARIIQVCSLIKKESTDTNKKLFFKLWAHEILRVFGDRVLEKDQEWVCQNIKFCVEQHFKEEFAHLFENLLKEGEEDVDLSKLLFGTFADNSGRFDESDFEKLEESANLALKEYNENSVNKMDLVLFEHALQSVARISRIVSIPFCNLIQVGMCGTGRQSITKLVCLLLNIKFFKLEITENFNTKDWHETVKAFLKEAGGYGRHCVFHLKEQDFVFDVILDDIYSLLKTGQIPFLYSLEENQEILDLVRNSIQESEECINISGDSESILLYYQKRCKENLHIVMSFNKSGSKFRRALRSYPSLLKFCEINYIKDWPQESFISIASAWTQNLQISKEIKTVVATLFDKFHKESQTINNGVHITTGAYLEFVRLFVNLINFKQKKITEVKQKYLTALEKLSFAAHQISEMQKSLADYQPQLEAMTEAATEMAKQIEKETMEVEKVSNLVKKDEEMANEQAAAAQVLKLDCEADLAQAIPILEDAISALNTLKPTDITLVKSMKNPPDAIKLVMAAVCVIKDVKPDRIPDPSTGRKTIDYWGPSKRILGDMNFLQTLKDFDKDNIKPEIMVKIRKDYLPHKDFKPHVVAKASSAAEGLCKWIIAMDMYDKVAKEVAPKKEKLEKAEREYAVTLSILNEKKEQVARIEEKLADLNATLKEATRKQRKLQRDVDICKRKLERAQKLIGGLSEEKIRWTNAVELLKEQFERLPGDIILSSAGIAYLGPFRKTNRKKLFDTWLNFVRENCIAFTENYNFADIFRKEADYDRWHLNGLPTDNFFVENGIIAKFSRRWPLFIDPQKQANTWIKLNEKQNGIKVTKFTCPNYLNVLKTCIASGLPLLIENVGETVKPFLVNVITRNTYVKNDTKFLNLGGTVVQFDENFFLYLTTNIKYPKFSSEIYDKLKIVDFGMNRETLEDQLLTCVVEVEKPTLKRVKKNLHTERKRNKDTLYNIEERILKTLSESKTDILEDEAALQILDESKILSKEIQQKQEDLKKTEQFLNSFREGYKTVGKHATSLYFTTYQLTKLNHMYQFSYNWFIETYSESIQKAHKYKVLLLRRKSLIATLNYELYCKICSSIFEKDKLFFSFLLVTNILIAQNKITTEELHFFTKCKSIEKLSGGPDWLPKKIWCKLTKLTEMEPYKDFLNVFMKFEETFKKIFNSSLPEQESLSEPLKGSFQKLLIISLLRPDRLHSCIYNFVESELGSQFVKPLFFDITYSYNESYILSPLIFIMKQGTDSVKALINFAKAKNFFNKLILASTRIGEEKKLEALINEGKNLGSWICLQNCHLLKSWLPLLDLQLEEIDYSNTHENFRLWLTTNETSDFPISLLERSVKITKEAPRGIRNQLSNSFLDDPINSPVFYTNCPGKHEIFTRLLYCSVFLHCVLQEKKRFGWYGWRLPYEFHENDLIISIRELQHIIRNREDPFDEMTHLIESCTYGGYITETMDCKLLKVIVRDYLNSKTALNSGDTFLNLFSIGIPLKSDHQDCLNHIMKLPGVDKTDIFGLHENYEVIRGLNESEPLFASINITFNDIIEEKKSTNVSDAIKTLHNQLPLELQIEKVSENFIINSILQQEFNLCNKLLISIKASLQNIQKVIEGEAVMSDELEATCISILENKIPLKWSKQILISSNCLSALKNHLNERVNYFKNFKYLPTQHIWLESFFNPKAILIATKLEYIKKKSILVDEIEFQLTSAPKDSQFNNGVLVSGLNIIGASWNKTTERLEELQPKITHQEIPLVYFTFTDVFQNMFKCPLYKHIKSNSESSPRNSSNFILPLLIPTEKSKEHWIRRRVAILCHI